jgi:aerobic carbon-monoxide dehydrogenase large subunit
MSTRYFGASVPRREDRRLITGKGRYVDDITYPGMAHLAFVRSDFAHAAIVSVDLEDARRLPGVIGAFGANDLGAAAGAPIAQAIPSPHLKQSRTYSPLAKNEVCHVGVPIAVIAAETRSIAEDAAALVRVEYKKLPAIIDWRRALDPGAPLAHRDIKDNRVAQLHNRFGDVEAIFAGAAHVYREQFETHRGGCHSMECRGVVCIYDQAEDHLTLFTSTQAPYLVRGVLAQHLGRDESSIRVSAPDVGGGFGPKCVVFPEEVVAPLVAMALSRPVKWIEDRREHFISTAQQRDQHWDVEVAADAEGRLLAVRGRCIHDNGGYVPYGLIAAVTSMAAFPGPYALQGLDVTTDVVFTNLVPNVPVRGAGRPTTCFVLERLADRVAGELGISREEVRRRSFVRADQFPYTTGTKARDGNPISYDSGDFHRCLEEALARYGDDFEQRREHARNEGRYLGYGIASFVEDTGLAPFEGASIRVQPSGQVLIQTGACSQGQGHATVLSQICADALSLPIDRITVESGDTSKFPNGIGTIASRVAVLAGSSVHLAATEIRKKAIKVAGLMLEASEQDLELRDGAVSVLGVPGHRVTLADLAKKLDGTTGMPMLKGIEPGLSATAFFNVDRNTFASGTNLAEVEVDPETGMVRVTRYIVAHDCGKLINPLLVDGQVRGGVVHGIGNALFERMIHDSDGQPQTVTYGEYLLPLASEMPRIEIIHIETPSPLNPLGVKGAGEGGTIPAAACVISAIEHALAPFSVRIAEHPVSPARLVELIAKAKAV